MNQYLCLLIRCQHWLPSGFIILVGVLSGGCGSRPRPPALRQNEPVYHNQHEGFSFTPPPGWNQQGRSGNIRDDRTHEHPLVKYKRATEAKPAFLEVSVLDLPGPDFTTFINGWSPGKDWRRLGQAEAVTVGQLPAVRQAFAGQWDREKIVKEVVAVQRKKSVYFIIGSFPANDTQARDTIRQTVGSLVWD
jgi:hypothetical protein